MPLNPIYSFDVFDTCLSRVSSLPASVFYMMAKIIMKDSDAAQDIFEFVNERMRAEREARTHTIPGQKEDVTLEEIYAVFRLNVPGYTKAAMMKLELETEAAVLRPIRTTATVIESARKNGKRVIFVSDIYLPESFLKERLEHFGLFREGDGLYVSSTIGLMKSSGRLFDYVREKEKVQFADIHHYGDHIHSDVKMPASKGMKTTLVNTGLNKYEHAWNSQAFAVNQPYDVYLMSGIAKSIRLSHPSSVHNDIVLNAIAPLFVPFVSWILRDARQRGIKKLYFLARDGYVLHEIAKILGVNYPEIELHYLYGSRRAFYLAGVKHASLDELNWIFPPVVGKTPRQMLKRINADESVIRSAMEKRGLGSQYLEAPLRAADHQLFIELLSDDESRMQLLAKAAEQREMVKAYFTQVGLCCNDGMGIVDIGWSRFCQHAVNVIIQPHQVFGYFFGVFDERVSISEAGPYAAAFYPEEFYSDECNKNLLKHEFLPILEQFFTLNNQRSTIGFTREESAVVPIFEEKSDTEPYKEIYFDKHLMLIREFANEYLRFEEFIQHPGSLIRNCGYRSVTMLMASPTVDEAAIFDKFMVDNGLGDPIPLVKKISVRQIMRRFAGSDSGSLEYVWPEGTIVHSFGEKGLRMLKLGRALKTWYRSGMSLTKLPY
ncbi:MAG: hypothetical protein WBP58_03175 [Chitinophagaceae bacterium]